MPQTTLTIRMDSDIKKRFEAFCADTGMNTAVPVNMFARAVLREKRIPFEIAGSDDPFFGVKNQTRLRVAMAQLETGKGKAHDLIEDDDAQGMSRDSHS